MTFGEDLGWGSSVDESEAILDRFLERGGNFIDTANVYTRGHSEKIIGDHLGRDPAKRDRVVIATKFFGNLYPGDPNGGGAGRKAIVAACEQSLRRLQTDYIDLYWMHCWDQHTPIEETMRALDDLVRAGKVRYIGFSDTPAWKVRRRRLIAQLPRLDAADRAADRVLADRAHGGGRAPADGARAGPRRHAVVAAARAACSAASTRGTTPDVKADRGSGYANISTERNLHDHRRADRASPRSTSATPAAVALAWVQAPPGRHLDDHRRAQAGAARAEPRRARRHADREQRSPRSTSCRASAQLPGGLPASATHVLARRRTTVNGEKRRCWPLVPKTDAERY